MLTPERLARLLDDHAAALELYAAQWAESPADVVQEAFIKLMQQSPPPAHVLPWLYRVVRNGAISSARSSSRRARHEQSAAEVAPVWFVDSEETSVDAQSATDALRELPEETREVVVARIWGGLSFEEIAELVGVASSTAHRRYNSALKALRKRLGLPCETNCETLTR